MGGRELIGEDELKELKEVIEHGILMRYGFHEQRKGVYKVKELEDAFKEYMGVKYALGVTSGTAALRVAMAALGIGAGDEVIVPSFTFVATIEAVIESNAIPVIAEIDDTLNIDPDDVERKITEYTKLIVPVHMIGTQADMDRIMAISHKYNIPVLEDTPQACGGSYKGRKVGTFGDIATFSFDFYKPATSGEGGILITNDDRLYKRAEWYHDHGHTHDAPTRALDEHPILGFNYRMGELQAAVALAQFRKIDEISRVQRENKYKIRDAIKEIEGITVRHVLDEEGDIGYGLTFSLPTEEKAVKFQEELQKEGVSTDLLGKNKWHFVANWEHILQHRTASKVHCPFDCPLYKGKYSRFRRDDFPQSSAILNRTLSMGINYYMTDSEIEHIVEAVRRVAERVL